MPVVAPVPIDPLAPSPAPGWYIDELVQVRGPGPARPVPPGTVRTDHFHVHHVGHRVHVDHWVPPARIDDDVAGLLARELFGPGWLRGTELFERIFTGVVRTSAPDAVESWLSFYRHTLVGIERALSGSGPAPLAAAGTTHGSIADYAPVYAHATSLLAPGSVLDLGCCFGFLSLRLAREGRPTTASDVSTGTVRLLATIAPLLGVRLETRVADASRFPGGDGCADTVLAIHLLEQLDPEQGGRTVAEAVRLARRRVVVAVPLGDAADRTWGDVRTVCLQDLDDWGRGTGLPYDVHEHHGGWLVVEKKRRRRPGAG